MSLTQEQIDELKRLDIKATAAPWAYDTTKNDGEYGSGDETHSGFDSFKMQADDSGKVLFDSLNSDAAVVEEFDSDGRAMDAVAHENFRLIEFLRNNAKALIAAAERDLASKSALSDVSADEAITVGDVTMTARDAAEALSAYTHPDVWPVDLLLGDPFIAGAADQLALSRMNESKWELGAFLKSYHAARLSSLLAERDKLRQERDEYRPYYDAVRGFHNGYDAEARKTMTDLKEPESPYAALKDLNDENEEMLSAEIELRLTAERERDEARAVVGRLPVDANGVKLMPGQEVYRTINAAPERSFGKVQSSVYWESVYSGRGSVVNHTVWFRGAVSNEGLSPSLCFASRESALASIAAPDSQPSKGGPSHD